jgi:formylglycine-generating enzyme required for sulfatase activity
LQVKKTFIMKNIFCLLLATVAVMHVTAQQKSVPGKIFRDCPDCPEMVVIPAGEFMMGSPETEKGRSANPDEGLVEGPQRLVTIQQFAAGKFDITKAEWAAFVKATNRAAGGNCGWANLPGADSTQPWLPDATANWNHVGFMQDSTHPVVCMSWNDAHDYTIWLSKKTGFTYRLLSEAEWEYADRAGTTTAYYWGTTAGHEYANYGTDTVNGIGFISGKDRWMFTSPVGSFPPNPFGLYDMNGNVMQWVDDCYAATYVGLPIDGSANKKNVSIDSAGKFTWMLLKNACSFHIVRGGCYADSPPLLRSAFRNWGGIPGAITPDLSRSAGGGFRIARTL